MLPALSIRPAHGSITRAPSTVEEALTPWESRAVERVVVAVLEAIPAILVQASLFGSKARGEARPDSDVDLLLVFRRLPPDREPHAGHAERLAAEIAEATRVPVNVWSVSLADLREGRRTPMLVDALADSLPVWCWPAPLPTVPFTRRDALWCARSLLDRVDEGGEEFSTCLRRADPAAAAARARDDLVRLCTALLLLRGVTRPRRAAVIDACHVLFPEIIDQEPELSAVLEWSHGSMPHMGSEIADVRTISPPPCDAARLARIVDLFRQRVTAHVDVLGQLWFGGSSTRGDGISEELNRMRNDVL